jgi:hypothetical protein
MEDSWDLLSCLSARELGGRRGQGPVARNLLRRVLLGRRFSQELAVLVNGRVVGGCLITGPGQVIEGAGRLLLPRLGLSSSGQDSGRGFDCYRLDTNRRGLRKAWSHPCRARVESWLVEDGCRPFPHPPSLLLLRADNRLERVDLTSGRLLASFFLSRHFRFTELTSDEERGWLVMTSVKGCVGRVSHLGCKSSDVLRSVLVLDSHSLDTICHFQVCKSLFGPNINGAELVSGLLLIMRTNSMVEAYSIDEVMRLASPLPPLSPSALSKGLPSTLALQGPLTRLWEVRTEHQHLQLQLGPWLYLRVRVGPGGGDLLCLHQLGGGGRLVKDGELAMDLVEEDQVTFHPDDSGRLVRCGSSGLQVYSVEETAERLELKQRLALKPPEEEDRRPCVEERTSRGRLIRRVSSQPAADEHDGGTVAFCYEDELEVLVTVHSREAVEGEESRAECIITTVSEVRIFDNRTLRLLMTVPLDLVSQRSAQDLRGTVSVSLDLDTLTVSIKSSSQTKVWVLRLLSDQQREEWDEYK